MKSAKAVELVTAGLSDQAVADALNNLDRSSPPMSYMAVSRHRRLHILKAAKDRLEIVAKGSAARDDRAQLAAAVSSDAPTPAQFVEAFFGLKAQAEKLQRIESRLERMAALAEDNQSPNGVAQVAAQQLRGVEVGAKVAGVGGYAPVRAADQAAAGVPFQINIIFSGSRETISLAAMPGAAPTLDAEDVDTEPDET